MKVKFLSCLLVVVLLVSMFSYVVCADSAVRDVTYRRFPNERYLIEHIQYLNGKFWVIGVDVSVAADPTFSCMYSPIAPLWGVWSTPDLRTWSHNYIEGLGAIGSFGQYSKIQYDATTDEYYLYVYDKIYKFKEGGLAQFVADSDVAGTVFAMDGDTTMFFDGYDIYLSSDKGLTAQEYSGPGPYIEDVVYADGTCVVVTADGVFTTTDFESWTEVLTDYTDNAASWGIEGVISYIDGAFYVALRKQTVSWKLVYDIYKSEDGVNWVQGTGFDDVDARLSNVFAVNGLLVSVTDSYPQKIYISDDGGLTWVESSTEIRYEGSWSLEEFVSDGTVAFGITNSRSTFVGEIKEAAADSNNVLRIDGTIEPLVISFTIPTNVDFSIDPNLGQPFVSPTLSISNKSRTPIHVELREFRQDPASEHKFTDVLPDAHDDWSLLTKEESSRDFALGVQTHPSDGWKHRVEGDRIFVAQMSTYKSLGVIAPESTVTMGFDAWHGLAFEEALSVKYKMVFVFSLP